MSRRSGGRASREGGVRLVKASRAFSEELERLMVEAGFSIERYGRDACEDVIHECVDRAYRQSWEEFMDWVMSGDSAGAALRAAMRESSYTRPTHTVK